MVTPAEGTAPELICLNELIRQGRIPDVDFLFQTALFGGRLDRGGLIVDFQFINPPDLAFAVQGEYFHYRLNGGSRANDILAGSELALIGVTLIYIDEDDLLTQPEYIVSEGLQFRDHSKLLRGK